MKYFAISLPSCRCAKFLYFSVYADIVRTLSCYWCIIEALVYLSSCLKMCTRRRCLCSYCHPVEIHIYSFWPYFRIRTHFVFVVFLLIVCFWCVSVSCVFLVFLSIVCLLSLCLLSVCCLSVH